jgi:hypothetical protein
MPINLTHAQWINGTDVRKTIGRGMVDRGTDLTRIDTALQNYVVGNQATLYELYAALKAWQFYHGPNWQNDRRNHNGTVTTLDADVIQTIGPDWNGNTDSWMGTLIGNPRLHEIVIPGSHDAGVYNGLQSAGGSPLSWAQCQTGNINQQALDGSRMFDLRMFIHNIGGGQWTVQAGHFPGSGSVKVGAYGGGLHSVLQDAGNFVNLHHTEFLILRFTKTNCVDAMVAEVRQLAQHVPPMQVYTGLTNIANTRVNTLAGHLVLVFDDEFQTLLNTNTTFQQQRQPGAVLPVGVNHYNFHWNLLFFDKYPTINARGLTTCGIYADSSDTEKVYEAAKRAAADHHQNHAGDRDRHLHFVYWQNTIKAGDIGAATGGPKGAHATLDLFAKEAVANVLNGHWDIPNVISHDFVSQATCTKIIDINRRMNPPKL